MRNNGVESRRLVIPPAGPLLIAIAFLAPRSRRKTPGLVEGTVEADLAHLRDLLDKQEAHAAAIRSKLDDLEHKTKRAAADAAASPGSVGPPPSG